LWWWGGGGWIEGGWNGGGRGGRYLENILVHDGGAIFIEQREVQRNLAAVDAVGAQPKQEVKAVTGRRRQQFSGGGAGREYCKDKTRVRSRQEK
jgi:hypothetical protein